VTGNFGAVLYGLGRFPAKVSVESVVRVVSALAMYVVVTRGGGLIGIALVSLVSALAKGMLYAAMVRVYLPTLRFSPHLASWDTLRTIRGYSVRAFVVMIAGRVSYRIDPIVIGAFLAPEEITYFVVAAQLVQYAKGAVSSLCKVLTPSAATLQARGEWQRLRSAYLKGSRWVVWLAVAIVVGIISLGKPFFGLWLSPAHAERAYPVLVVLGVPLILALPGIAASRLLYGLGELREFTWLAIVQACANLLLSVLLVGRYGILGVALGTALPNIPYFLATTIVTCRYVRTPIFHYYRSVFLVPFPPGVLLFGLWCSWNAVGALTGWAPLVVAGTVGLLLYSAIAFSVEGGFRRTTQAGGLDALRSAEMNPGTSPTVRP